MQTKTIVTGSFLIAMLLSVTHYAWSQRVISLHAGQLQAAMPDSVGGDTIASRPKTHLEVTSGQVGAVLIFFTLASVYSWIHHKQKTGTCELIEQVSESAKHQARLERVKGIAGIGSASGKAEVLEKAYNLGEHGKAIIRADGTFYFFNQRFSELIGQPESIIHRSTINQLLPWLKDHSKWVTEYFVNGKSIPDRQVSYQHPSGMSRKYRLGVDFFEVRGERLATVSLRKDDGEQSENNGGTGGQNS